MWLCCTLYRLQLQGQSATFSPSISWQAWDWGRCLTHCTLHSAHPYCPPPPPPDFPPASFINSEHMLTRWTAARQLNRGDVISSATSAKAHGAPRPRLVMGVVCGCLRSVRSERADSGTARTPQPRARLSQLLTPGRRDVTRHEIPHINLWPLPVSQGAEPPLHHSALPGLIYVQPPLIPADFNMKKDSWENLPRKACPWADI